MSEARITRLDELAILCSGYSPRPEERRRHGKYLLLGGRNIKNGYVIRTEKDTYMDDVPKESFRRAIARPGDIIVSTLFDRRKLCIYRETDPEAVVNSSCAIIRAPKTNDYILSYLRTLKGQEDFLRNATNATSGTFIPRLSVQSLSQIEIPLLPLLELQRLGDEHIEASTNDELVELRNDLQSKDEKISSLETELVRVTEHYENRINKIEAQISTNDLKSRIAHGETSKLEFKSSLRWNLKAHRDDTNLELAVLKTIAAFCNTDGGELLIGVADDHSILGIEHDHFLNDDKFLLHLRNLLTDKIVPTVVQYVKYELVNVGDKKICQVVCKRSIDDVWVRIDKNETEVFCVRSGPSSTVLPPREASRYIREHFQK